MTHEEEQRDLFVTVTRAGFTADLEEIAPGVWRVMVDAGHAWTHEDAEGNTITTPYRVWVTDELDLRMLKREVQWRRRVAA